MLNIAIPQLSSEDFRSLISIAESLLKIIGIVLGTWLAARFLLAFLDKSAMWLGRRLSGNRSHEESLVEAKRMHTLVSIGRSTLSILIYMFAGLLIMSELGVNIGPLLAGAGVLGVAVAFGAQSLVKDVFYGFFILAENQFSLGDVIQVGDTGPAGQVERMTFRTVTLRDLDGRAIIVPNGEITRVTVFSKEWSRANIDMMIPYEADLDQVFALLRSEGEKLHQLWPTILLETPQVLGVDALEELGMKVKVIAKTKPLSQWDVMRELRKRYVTALQKSGIGIPFPRRMIAMENTSIPKQGLPIGLAANGSNQN